MMKSQTLRRASWLTLVFCFMALVIVPGYSVYGAQGGSYDLNQDQQSQVSALTPLFEAANTQGNGNLPQVARALDVLRRSGKIDAEQTMKIFNEYKYMADHPAARTSAFNNKAPTVWAMDKLKDDGVVVSAGMQQSAQQAAVITTTNQNAGTPTVGGTPNSKLVLDTNALKQKEKEANYPERLVAGIFISVPKFFIDVLKIKDPAVLIFQAGAPSSSVGLQTQNVDPNTLVLKTFTNNEFKAITKMFDHLIEFTPITLTLAIVIGALGVYFSSWGEQRATYKDLFKGIVIAFVMIKLSAHFFYWAFNLSYAGVVMFRSSLGAYANLSFFEMLWEPETRSLAMALISLIATLSIGILNWQYIVRKIILSVLIFMLPVVATVAIIPSRRFVLNMWFKEFFSNLLLQPAHAAAYAFFILFMQGKLGNLASIFFATPAYANTASQVGQSDPDVFWYAMAFLLSINTVTNLIRGMIGAESAGSGVLGAAGNMMGVGSLLAIGAMAKGVTGGAQAVNGASMESMTQLANGKMSTIGNLASHAGSSVTSVAGKSPSALTSAISAAQHIGAQQGWAGKAAATWSATKQLGAGLGKQAMLHSASKGAKLASRIVKGGAMGAGFLAGTAMTGNAGTGAAIAKAAGMAVSPISSGLQTFGDMAKGIRDEHQATGDSLAGVTGRKLGIYDSEAQMGDPESMATAGQALFGSVGKYAGGALGHVNKAVNRITGDTLNTPVAEGLSNHRNAMRSQFQNTTQAISQLQPDYNIAKERLNIAQSNGKSSPEYLQAQSDFYKISNKMSDYKIKQMESHNFLTNGEQVKQKLVDLRAVQTKQRINRLSTVSGRTP